MRSSVALNLILANHWATGDPCARVERRKYTVRTSSDTENRGRSSALKHPRGDTHDEIHIHRAIAHCYRAQLLCPNFAASPNWCCPAAATRHPIVVNAIQPLGQRGERSRKPCHLCGFLGRALAALSAF